MKRLLLGSVIAHALWSSAFAQIDPQSALRLNDGETTIAKGNKVPAQMATIDPKTGQLISKPAEVEEQPSQDSSLGGAQSQSFELSGGKSTSQLMSDGSTKIDFNGQFMIPLKAEVNSDGDVRTGHHIDAQDVQHQSDHRD